MKRKLLNGLLLVAASCATVGTFTSCKDELPDVKQELLNADAALKARLDALEQTVSNLQGALDACKTECNNKFADVLRRLGVAESDIAALKVKDGQIDEAIDQLIAKINNHINNHPGDGTGLSEDEVKAIVQDMLNNYVPEVDLSNYVTKDELQDAIKDFVTTTCDCAALKEKVEGLDTWKNLISKNFDEDGNLILPSIDQDLINNMIDAKLTSINRLLGELASVVGEGDLATLLGTLIGDVQDVQGILSGVSNQDLVDAIAAAEFVRDNKIALETLISFASTLGDTLDDLQDQIDLINDVAIPGLQGQIDDINDLLDSLGLTEGGVTGGGILGDINTSINNLGDDITEINGTLGDYAQQFLDIEAEFVAVRNEINTKVANLQAEMNQLFNRLENRINSLITGIINQGCYNPLFGTFSLPIGVQSNMLFNFSGRSEHGTYDFPTQTKSASFDNEYTLTESDVNMLMQSGNYHPIAINEGDIFYNELEQYPGQIFLGKTFVTINPNNINFEGNLMPLVNSRDEATPIVLKMRKSNELLDFGYTRANNGFYEADAVMPATKANIDKISLKIDDGLKSAAKEILEDPKSRSNIFHMLKGVYDQISGILPAYGLKAGWSVDGKEYAVYSNYNIAATTFRPLSYSTLYGKHIDRKLPIIDEITENLIDIDPTKYKFHFNDIDLSGVTTTLDFQFDDFDFDFAFNLSYDKPLVVKGTVTINYPDGPKEEPITAEVSQADMQDFLNSLSNQMQEQIKEQFMTQLNEQVAGWNEQLDAAFSKAIDSLISQIQTEVNEMMRDMEAEINGKLDDMISDIEGELNHRVGQYLDKFNKFISKYNDLAKRINKVLKDPNHYMQPTMVYNSKNNGIHFLSNNPLRPTKFNMAGGNALTLYPTSYNAEVLTPAYKKFIACVNVTKDGKSAKDGDATLLNALKKINNMGQMNTVFKGAQRRFALPIPADAVKGATYEIVYAAVDYHGTTSTRRFFFTVK